ncbi:hypothetical protein MRS76_08090 [Rhizobiaceae bacterium n13]|uniref:Uncharacterized protein n=1 Tax=Ferirhizobium litorale TaxID=2927786 RepID=A0AAE3QF08_9HYPH|nr:hypothetical protein [Fererhizobium litorale]MDI7861913.1 hypothetical protein [Fererhizobium litorale]MDI7922815.1 hypothetical protein [Fererhizobium litorale]
MSRAVAKAGDRLAVRQAVGSCDPLAITAKSGVGVTDVPELEPDLVDPLCQPSRRNSNIGQKSSASLLTVWNPTNDKVFPQLFDDAIRSWRTGEFEGENVFRGVICRWNDRTGDFVPLRVASQMRRMFGSVTYPQTAALPDNAGIRIDLTRGAARTSRRIRVALSDANAQWRRLRCIILV